MKGGTMDRTQEQEQRGIKLPFILRFAERAPMGDVIIPGDPLLGRESTTVTALGILLIKDNQTFPRSKLKNLRHIVRPSVRNIKKE